MNVFEGELSEVENARRVIAATERREAMLKKATDLIAAHLGLSLRERGRGEGKGYWVEYAILSPTGKEVAAFTLVFMDYEGNVSLGGTGSRVFDWIEDIQFELKKLNRVSR